MKTRCWMIGAAVGVLCLTVALVDPLRQTNGIALFSNPISPSSSGTVVKSVRGGLVHAVTLICPIAPCEVALFNVATATDGGTAAWEGRVGTNNSSLHMEFPKPLILDTGITVQVGAGKAFVAYE